MILLFCFLCIQYSGASECESFCSDSTWSSEHISDRDLPENLYENVRYTSQKSKISFAHVSPSLCILEAILLVLRSLDGFKYYVSFFSKENNFFTNFMHRFINDHDSIFDKNSFLQNFLDEHFILDKEYESNNIEDLLSILTNFIIYLDKKNDTTDNATNVNAKIQKIALQNMFCLTIQISKRTSFRNILFAINDYGENILLKNIKEKIKIDKKKILPSKYTNILYSFKILNLPSYIFIKYSEDFSKLLTLPKNQESDYIFSFQKKKYTLFGFLIFRNVNQKFEYYCFYKGYVVLYEKFAHTNLKISCSFFLKKLAYENIKESLLVLGL